MRVLCVLLITASAWSQTAGVRILTLNILKGGEELGQPLQRTIDIIGLTQADVVVLQEQEGNAEPIAGGLGFHHEVLNESVAVLSRWPIAEPHRHGVTIAHPAAGNLHVFGVHLEAYPYGPYDLRDDPSLTADQLIATAETTRGRPMKAVLREMQPFIEGGEPTFVGGDFNEPSHSDWTEAAKARHFERVVAWPASTAVAAAGMTDSYRAVHTDPAEMPGDTWTPTPEENEVHDRIDRLYHAGRNVAAMAAFVVGESMANADMVFVPYPTDHRGVLITYALDPATAR